jgi:hypothetical protein
MEIGRLYNGAIAFVDSLRAPVILDDLVGNRNRSKPRGMRYTDPAAVRFNPEGPFSLKECDFANGIEKVLFSPCFILIAQITDRVTIWSKLHTNFEGGEGINLAFDNFKCQVWRLVCPAGKAQQGDPCQQ